MGGIGGRLREIRQRRGLTQKEAAERLQLSRISISHYEQSHRTPDYATLVKLADLYRVSLDCLIKAEAPLPDELPLWENADRTVFLHQLAAMLEAGKRTGRYFLCCLYGQTIFRIFPISADNMRLCVSVVPVNRAGGLDKEFSANSLWEISAEQLETRLNRFWEGYRMHTDFNLRGQCSRVYGYLTGKRLEAKPLLPFRERLGPHLEEMFCMAERCGRYSLTETGNEHPEKLFLFKYC